MNIKLPFGWQLTRGQPEAKKTLPRHLGRAFGRGARARLSLDTSDDLPFMSALFIKSPENPVEQWRAQNLDSRTLDNISPDRLMEMLLDVSPDVSRALWDFLRFCNSGWSISATVPNTENEHQQATLALDEMLKELKRIYGSPNVQFNRLFMSAFFRGAYFVEMVLDESKVADLAVPDAATARFRKRRDPIRGTVWELGQMVSGNFISLEDFPTVQYIPIDPLPAKPFGRPMMTPAVNLALFTLGLLNDLKRVIQQQGYPRLDIEVILEKLMEAMPEGIEDDPEKFRQWAEEIVSEVEDAYSNLLPDDAYIHTDVIRVNRPVGTVDSSSLGAVDGIMRALDRMIVRALKTMPLLFGIVEGSSESYANRQWEIHMAGIRTLQKTLEETLETLFEYALQAQGIVADVTLTFEQLRASERLRLAQAFQMEINNQRSLYEFGIVSLDRASDELIGAPADQAEPRIMGGTTEIIEGDGDGQERLVRFLTYPNERHKRVVQVSPDGSEQPLPEEPAEVEITDNDRARVRSLWDDLMPDYETLLVADIIGRTDFDEDTLGGVHESEWEYEVGRRRYRHKETGELVNQIKLTQLRDEFTDKLLSGAASSRSRVARSVKPTEITKRDTDELADRLANGEITIQRWLLDMRQEIKEAYVAEYTTAKGGQKNMTFSDYGRIGNMLAPRGQYARLQAFADKIANGEKSLAQIKANARQYIASSTQAFERGRAAAVGLTLPEYPADGSQTCLSNCRCVWRIVERSDAWHCTWKVNSAAEHCDSCVENSRRWSPLIISKTQANSRADVTRLLKRLNQNGHEPEKVVS